MNKFEKRIRRKQVALEEIKSFASRGLSESLFYAAISDRQLIMQLAAKREIKDENFEFYCRYGYFLDDKS